MLHSRNKMWDNQSSLGERFKCNPRSRKAPGKYAKPFIRQSTLLVLQSFIIRCSGKVKTTIIMKRNTGYPAQV